jgi:D-alanyl-D-alanine dipeptidase
VLANSSQVVVVVVPDWTSVEGELRRFERGPDGGSLVEVGKAFPVVVGRGGLGWGRGLHEEPPTGGAPFKREGDNRAPAGVFDLVSTFGYAGKAPAGAGLPYQRVTEQWHCIDDVESPDYNRLKKWTSGGPPPWKSSEILRRRDNLYRWAVVVGHNTAPKAAVAPAPNRAGSCIFLHVWRAAGAGTAGCTAMDEEQLVELISWLDADRSPRLVQLTAGSYRELSGRWGLPPQSWTSGPM